MIVFQQKMKVFKGVLFCVFIVIYLISCTEIQVKEERKTVTGIGADEKISFVLDRSLITDVKDAAKIELKIEKCITKALNKLNPSVQTVSAKTFRKTVFPDFEYLSIPSSPESIMTLLNNMQFKDRIKLLGIRYLLILQREYSSADELIGGCIGGGQGAACLAFLVWDNKTKFSVRVIDVINKSSPGDVKAEATGHPWVGIVLVFPVGFPGFSEGPACNAIGKQVASFIVNNQPKR
jgi:hypothetical protein